MLYATLTMQIAPVQILAVDKAVIGHLKTIVGLEVAAEVIVVAVVDLEEDRRIS